MSKEETRTGAISVKGGSDQILIDGNMISDIRSDGVLVGGWTSPRMASRPVYEGFEARNVCMTGNVVERVGKRAVNIMAAQCTEISGNYLDVSQGYGVVIELGRTPPRGDGTLFVGCCDFRQSVQPECGQAALHAGDGGDPLPEQPGRGRRPAISAGPRPQAVPFLG